MMCEKVSFGITDRLLLVDVFDCELPEFSHDSVGSEFQVNRINVLIFRRCFCW